MKRVLLVEDDAKIRGSLLLQLGESGLAVEALASGEEAFVRLTDRGRLLPDLLLLDVRLGGMSGVELIRLLASEGGAGRLPPTIIVSGEASISETVEALRLGVHDFIEKPFSRERLLRSIENTLETVELKRRVAALESKLVAVPEILGGSPALLRLKERIARAAATDGRVLIIGESGTGKELVADALHRAGARKDGPFVKINCAAIPAPLVEDELFGHARGAFTDAKVAKPGLFEEAHGGTLFLDEIGDMDSALQARLLRVLEDGRVRRVGETRDRQVDVRVIAATHRDLEREGAEGRFRQDLYFRLAALPIEVPALRERGEDIPLLFASFVERFSREHRLRQRRVDPGIYPPLLAYSWPGNVRELKNLSERLVVFGGDPLQAADLPAAFSQPARSARSAGREDTPETGLLRLPAAWPALSLRDFRNQCEREYLEAVLRRTDWNFAAAARLLGLQRTYLHQKVASLGLERPARGGRREEEEG
jgi:two-component system nitrogen regulation response regulator NtrX